jgi:hypothetical protein
MKRAFVFLALALGGFVGYQWWISRRSNEGLRSYFDTTARSMDESAAAGERQLDAISLLAAPLAVVKDIRGILFNGSKMSPILTASGEVVLPEDKNSDDLSSDQGETILYFGT